MKHLKKKREFNRVSKQRNALMRTMLGSLVMREKITTTEAKAKELKKEVDRVINNAKKIKDDKRKVSAIRHLDKTLPRMAVKKLSGSFIEKFSSRTSGYTRVIKTGRRKSDNALMAIIEFVQ